ncbi:MAG TPA: hypothetical protein VNS81_03655 [Nocardioides sp.]|nr:hypothetical protein [Nocardioides sp.]
MRKVLGGLSILTFLVSGCGGPGDHTEPTAQSAARVLRSEIGEITQLLAIDEDNDPNELLGRPNGYVAATVIFDSRVSCDSDDPGVDCGATIEQWPSPKAAKERSNYIQSLQAGSSLLGSEWNTVRGELLLRVSGEMKPSDAEAYADVFEAADLAADVGRGVAATSGPTSPAAEPWALVDSGFGAAHGYAWTIARVMNHADHGGQTVTVNFNLRDESGALLASGSQVSHFSWPGQVLPVATDRAPRGGGL